MILKKRPGRVFGAAALVMAGFCDPALTALFTPRHPLLGRYEACTDPRPLADVAPAGWTVETLDALDAFGAARPYDRAALARVYGGVRARVARGWTQTPDRFESLTFISPYPNRAMTALDRGTLLIRWTCDNRLQACTMPSVR